MKRLMASLIAICAGTAEAHPDCNLTLDGGMRISASAIEFYEEGVATYQNPC